MSDLARRVVARFLSSRDHEAARLTGPARDALKKVLMSRGSLYDPMWAHYAGFVKGSLKEIEEASGAKRLLRPGVRTQRDADVERAYEALELYPTRLGRFLVETARSARAQLNKLQDAITAAESAGATAKRVLAVRAAVKKAADTIEDLAHRTKPPARHDADLVKQMEVAAQALKEMDAAAAGAYKDAETLLK